MEVAALGLRVDGIQDADKASAALDKLAKSADGAANSVSSLSSDAKSFKPSFDSATQSAEKLTAAEQKLAAQAAAAGMSTRQLQSALRGVPAQFTDIAVSLQAGQAPLTVFLQQGGQLKDMFGGAGAAAKALSQYVVGLVNPFTVAAAAVGTLAVAYHQGSKELDAYVLAIQTSGNAAGVTTSQLVDYAKQIDAAGSTQAKAAEALSIFVSAGVSAEGQLRQFTQTAIEWEKYTGEGVDVVAKKFVALQKDPLAAAVKLNEGMNFLTASTYDQIASLEEQGRKTEAAALAMSELDAAMAQRSKTIQSNLGYIQRGWMWITGAAKEAWDAMLNIGRPQAIDEKLVQAQEALRKMQAEGPGLFDRAQYAKRISAQNELVASLEAQSAAEALNAAVSAQNAKDVENRVEINKKYSKYLKEELSLSQSLKIAREELTSAGKAEADIQRALNAITEEYNKKNRPKQERAASSAGTSELASIIARVEATNKYIQALRDQGDAAKKVTEGEQLAYKIQAEIDSGRLKSSQLVQKQKELEAAKSLKVAQETLRAEEKLVEVQKKREEENDKAYSDILNTQEKSLDSLKKQIDAEKLATEAIGKTAEEIARLEIVKLQDVAASKERAAITWETIDLSGYMSDSLRAEAQAYRELADAKLQRGITKTNYETAKQAEKDWEKVSDTIGKTLSDYIMGGGKDAATYLKRLFSTLVLQPVVQTAVSGFSGLFGGGAQGSAGGALGTASNLQSLYGAFSGGLTSSIGGAIGSLGSMFGSSALTSMAAGIKGSTLAAGLAGPTTAGATGAMGLGASLGAALPWVAGGLAAAQLLGGLFDHKRTQEYGGTAMYSAALGAQTSTTRGAFGTGFGGVAASEEILANVSGISKSIVDALDATAKSFGKTVGYEAAAGFASDFGDEATWGGLRIALGGMDIVNWDMNRQSRWAPKEFASGEEGYKQYLNAVAADVKTAVLSMDLPTWADQLLTAANDLDSVNAALQQIGTVKAMFDSLGQSMQAFSGISGELQTQLLSASGGIDKLSANTSAFYQGFFSEQERADAQMRQLRESLSGLGIGIDPSLGEHAKEQFRATVEAAMAGGQGELAAQLLALSGSFATAADYAQKSADDSVARLNEIMGQQHMLWADLAAAEGDFATAAQRRYWIETAGMNEAEQAAYDYIAAIKAQVSAAQAASASLKSLSEQQWSLENQLLSLQGQTGLVESRTREKDLAALLEGVTDEDKRRQIAASYDYNRALEKQIEALQASQKAASDAAASQQRAADSMRQSWQSIGDSVLSEINRIRGVVVEESGFGLEYYQSQFAIATAQARAGDQSAAERLPELSKALLQMAAASATSLSELQRYRTLTAGSLEATLAGIQRQFGITVDLPSASAARSVSAAPTPFDPWAGGSLPGFASASVEVLLETLIENQRSQAADLGRLSLRTARVLEKWDNDGLPEERS